MTLRDPDNSGRWADGAPRSQGTPFDTAYRPDPQHRIDLKREQQHAAAKIRTTKNRERRLQAGLERFKINP